MGGDGRATAAYSKDARRGIISADSLVKTSKDVSRRTAPRLREPLARPAAACGSRARAERPVDRSKSCASWRTSSTSETATTRTATRTRPRAAPASARPWRPGRAARSGSSTAPRPASTRSCRRRCRGRRGRPRRAPGEARSRVSLSHRHEEFRDMVEARVEAVLREHRRAESATPHASGVFAWSSGSPMEWLKGSTAQPPTARSYDATQEGTSEGYTSQAPPCRPEGSKCLKANSSVGAGVSFRMAQALC